MLNSVDFFYFSPTGGTRSAGKLFCERIAVATNEMNLASIGENRAPGAELAVLAAPVFGGRIPEIAIEKMKQLNGHGKKAVTLAVYGNRDYDDALLELNDTAIACGYQLVASAALIARHSIVPEVAEGRPDAQDAASIAEFARNVLAKLESGSQTAVSVPGNRPYKTGMNMSVSPIALPNCGGCGKCVSICPTGAIRMEAAKPVTNVEKCILCMACTAHCPEKARILPPPLQETMNEKLGALKAVRRENAYFL